MTKKQLIKILKDLNDDAHITVAGVDDSCELNIVGWRDKVTGKEVENEITLVCE